MSEKDKAGGADRVLSESMFGDEEDGEAFEAGARSRDAEVADLTARMAAVREELLAARVALQDAADAATPLLTDAVALALLKETVLGGLARLNHADMLADRGGGEVPSEQIANCAGNLSMVIAQAVDDYRGRR